MFESRDISLHDIHGCFLSGRVVEGGKLVWGLSGEPSWNGLSDFLTCLARNPQGQPLFSELPPHIY